MKTSVRMALNGALASVVLITPIALAQNPTATVNVDVNANRHAISPFIYGVAYGGSALSDLNAPLNRYGGNNSSHYNWMLNADNRDADWYFESIADTSATPGERGDTFIGSSKTAGARPMITIPMLDYVATLGPMRIGGAYCTDPKSCWGSEGDGHALAGVDRFSSHRVFSSPPSTLI